MAWFHREREPAPIPREPGPREERDALRDELSTLRRFLNHRAGRLPNVSVVTAHQIGDVLCTVVDGAGDHMLDAYTAVRLRGFLTDYLPTTLRSFLAVGDRTGGATGSTAAGILQEQLESLLDEANALLASSRSHDSNALLTQGAFLRTKFSRSDLDL